MPRITGTPRGYMTPDGSEITMTLGDDEGGEHELTFLREAFESFLRQSHLLIGQAKQLETGVVHGIETVGFGVTPLTAENKLLVTFVGDGSLKYHFALPASEGPQFRDDMLAAEKKCKEAGPPTAH